MLTCHRGPDGDSIGSLVALASLLRERNRMATIYTPDLVPRHLKWLPHLRTVTHKLKEGSRYQVTVVVDCGDRSQLGTDFPGPDVTGRLVVLDHHAAGSEFGDVSVCDPEAASVGVLVARMARLLDWELSADAALGIYVSLVCDTGFFRHPNSNAEAFELAAEFVGQLGVDANEVSERLSRPGTLGRCKLLSAALNTLEVSPDGSLAFMTITDEMVRSAGAGWDDTDGMVSYARSLKGVECGVLLTPAKGGGTRVSVRSQGLVDAGAACQSMGGGGHRGAAGCVVQCDLVSARAQIECILQQALESARGGKVSAVR